MAESIDARGLSCPEPVILTRKALEGAGAGEEVVVLVDTMTQVYNCARAGEDLGWKAAWEEKGDDFEMRFRR
jgi:tRNA 2-thiouridine synthesizing protein A